MFIDHSCSNLDPRKIIESMQYLGEKIKIFTAEKKGKKREIVMLKNQDYFNNPYVSIFWFIPFETLDGPQSQKYDDEIKKFICKTYLSWLKFNDQKKKEIPFSNYLRISLFDKHNSTSFRFGKEKKRPPIDFNLKEVNSRVTYNNQDNTFTIRYLNKRFEPLKFENIDVDISTNDIKRFLGLRVQDENFTHLDFPKKYVYEQKGYTGQTKKPLKSILKTTIGGYKKSRKNKKSSKQRKSKLRINKQRKSKLRVRKQSKSKRRTRKH